MKPPFLAKSRYLQLVLRRNQIFPHPYLNGRNLPGLKLFPHVSFFPTGTSSPFSCSKSSVVGFPEYFIFSWSGLNGKISKNLLWIMPRCARTTAKASLEEVTMHTTKPPVG